VTSQASLRQGCIILRDPACSRSVPIVSASIPASWIVSESLLPVTRLVGLLALSLLRSTTDYYTYIADSGRPVLPVGSLIRV
jgi:hypothetical protein